MTVVAAMSDTTPNSTAASDAGEPRRASQPPHNQSSLSQPPQIQPPQGPPQGRSRGPSFWMGICAMVLALGSGIATSLILTGSTRISPTNDVFQFVILINIIVYCYVAIRSFTNTLSLSIYL